MREWTFMPERVFTREPHLGPVTLTDSSGVCTTRSAHKIQYRSRYYLYVKRNVE